MGVRLDPPVQLDDFPLVQLQCAYRVSVAAIHDSLMRGTLTVEECNDRVRDLQENYAALRGKLEKKA